MFLYITAKLFLTFFLQQCNNRPTSERQRQYKAPFCTLQTIGCQAFGNGEAYADIIIEPKQTKIRHQLATRRREVIFGAEKLSLRHIANNCTPEPLDPNHARNAKIGVAQRETVFGTQPIEALHPHRRISPQVKRRMIQQVQIGSGELLILTDEIA